MVAIACLSLTVTAFSVITGTFLSIKRRYGPYNTESDSASSWAHGPVGDPPDILHHEWYAPTTTVACAPSPTHDLPPAPALSKLASLISHPLDPSGTGSILIMIIFVSILIGCLLSLKKHRRAGHQHGYVAEYAINCIFPVIKLLNGGLAQVVCLSLWLFRAYEDSWAAFHNSFWWAANYLGKLLCDRLVLAAEYLGLLYPMGWFVGWFAVGVIQQRLVTQHADADATMFTLVQYMLTQFCCSGPQISSADRCRRAADYIFITSLSVLFLDVFGNQLPS
ncbi:hypothetical protein BKA62DRAFT_674411 [Auriculariales sp. MPI-PUGE-AT-0066]|nr:hypothetical protein BKA62DRAFT_674411 [Auriculariales sp. MPI-PUGE-AT-0066]